ncbi:MAG: ABC transporter permease [Thermomicrobiales bacterium]|nr:ABC transporter permease [Thermomicrobiales bacterium]MCO5223077.1 ABC transporter permease [Thermomicrobiales bacterium]
MSQASPVTTMAATLGDAAVVSPSRPPRPGAGAFMKVVREPIGLIGLVIIVTLIVVAILAPVIAPYPPDDQPGRRLESPNSTYWLGTDDLGRDIFSRLLYGARVSLQVGIIAVGIALVIGGILGLLSGYYVGIVDALVQRLVDILLAFPTLILVIALTTVMGASTATAMIAIGIAYSPAIARVVRGATLQVRQEQYVEAGKTIGVGPSRMILRHIVPNIAPPVIVQSTLLLSTAILAEAALSFLGLGTQPPAASWGAMLGAGRKYMETAPWVAIFPGLAISITVLGFNLLGDAMRDALDPRLRQR